MDSTIDGQTQSQVDEQLQHIKGAIESLLFVNEKPVTMEQIKKMLETVNAPEIKKAIQVLKEDHEERKSGMMIVEIAGGYQMLSNPLYAQYLRDFYKTKHKEKLSKPALESMAIIAYKQPVTRAEIEMIRGVNSDGVVAHLLNKELIKVVGRKDVPGRPYVYGTTKQFMEYFGLKSLDDLPVLEEFPSLEPASEDRIIPADLEGEETSGDQEQPDEPGRESNKEYEQQKEQETGGFEHAAQNRIEHIDEDKALTEESPANDERIEEDESGKPTQ